MRFPSKNAGKMATGSEFTRWVSILQMQAFLWKKVELLMSMPKIERHQYIWCIGCCQCCPGFSVKPCAPSTPALNVSQFQFGLRLQKMPKFCLDQDMIAQSSNQKPVSLTSKLKISSQAKLHAKRTSRLGLAARMPKTSIKSLRIFRS